MRSIFLASSALALALVASSARAEDVEYANHDVVFATAVDPAPIVTSDVAYEGPHAVIVKEEPGPGRAFVASYDDVRYGADSLSPTLAPAQSDEAQCLVAQSGPVCPHHG